jgi:hypothetical protein
MGSIAAGGYPVSRLKNAGQLAAGGLAAIAEVVKAKAGPLVGLIMQVAAVGGGVAARAGHKSANFSANLLRKV